MQIPRLVKITVNMGVGDAKQSTPMLEAATEQLATITGQHPNVRRARKSIANFKLREGMPVGRLGDPARRPHVGVPRPPDHDLDPADPRLPRPQPALVRRPRQLLARRPRAADLPRDRLRLDRRGPRPRHRDHDHRRDRRGGLRAAARARDAVRRGRAPGPGRHGRRGRGGAPQGGGPRSGPRPRQAALEQLKEENPEAYAKPERPEEGEEGEEGAEGAEGGDGEETSSDESSEE